MAPTWLTTLRNSTTWQRLLLAVLLLGAQALLSVHALSHLDADATDSCDICLVGSSLSHAHSATAAVQPSVVSASHCSVAPSAAPLLQAPAPSPCQRGPPRRPRII